MGAKLTRIGGGYSNSVIPAMGVVTIANARPIRRWMRRQYREGMSAKELADLAYGENITGSYEQALGLAQSVIIGTLLDKV